MVDNLGRYVIRGELGKGAQSTVYLGLDPQSRRQVVLKLLHSAQPDPARNRAIIESAKRVMALRHPTIVPLLDVGESGSEVFFVRESIAGVDLASTLRQSGSMSPAKALGVLKPVLGALAAAHRLEMYQSGVKASNVIMGADGLPHLVDFGVAANPIHCAPEYLSQRQVLPAGDVFGAGLVLFEMLTGRPAVPAGNTEEALRRLRDEDIRLPQSVAVDERLATIVHKALARDPVLRYHGIDQFSKAIDDYLQARDTPASSSDKGKTALDTLIRRVRNKADFPALSESVAAINRIASSENERADKLSNAILQDFALTNQLVRIVNSAYYRPAGGGSITTVSRAVAVLGFETTRNIAITVLLLEHMQNKAVSKQLKEDFIRINMAGLLARQFALHSKQRDLEEVFICAMFHGLGRLLAHFYFHEETAEISRVMAEKNCGEEVAAQRVIGITFEELGIAIAELWGFPPLIVNAMRKLPPGTAASGTSVEDRLRVVSAIANEVCDVIAITAPENMQSAFKQIEERAQSAFGLRSKALRDTVRKAMTEVSAYSRVMRIELSKTEFGRQLDRFLQPPTASGAAAPTLVPVQAAEEPTPSNELPGELVVAEEQAEALVQDAKTVLAAGIQEISNTLVSSFKLNDVLRTILETMYRGIGFRRVLLCTRDATTGMMQGRYGFGPDSQELAKRFSFEITSAPDIFCAVTSKGVDILIRDVDDPKIESRVPEWYRKAADAKSFLLLPINIKGKPVALIYADQLEANAIQIPEQELALLRTLRNQAVLAIKMGRAD